MLDVNEIMRELAQYMRLQEEITTTVDGLKDQIKQYMIENNIDILTGDEHKASYKTVMSNRVDTAAMKKALPDVVAQYTKTTESKRFLFS